MTIERAQREMRARYAGGFYGQLVSGILWLASAVLGTWARPGLAIVVLVVGGFFIFPLTELLVRVSGPAQRLSPDNALRALGMQVAFVLPLSMPLLLPVGLYRLTLFYPGMMILLGAHYLPFVTLYGMRLFAVLAAVLVAGGLVIAVHLPGSFGAGAWVTGVVLLVFAAAGRVVAAGEPRQESEA
jgi:hypothetical protein